MATSNLHLCVHIKLDSVDCFVIKIESCARINVRRYNNVGSALINPRETKFLAFYDYFSLMFFC